MAPRKKTGLSERQINVLHVLESFQEKKGYPPSIREIGKRANISSTSVVNYYLEQLEEMGYISRDKNVSRGVRVLKNASGDMIGAADSAVDALVQGMGKLVSIPIIGRIVASEPAPVPSSDFAYFDTETAIEVASSLIPSRDSSSLYALEVQGDSMIDAMVFDGDIVIMKPAQEVRNGEMVAVWLQDKDETTLKYFYKEGKPGVERIRLQPANPTMSAIYVEDQKSLRIQGKVVMVIRQVDRVN